MIQVLVKAVGVALVAMGLSGSISSVTPHLEAGTRWRYSVYIATAAELEHVDPYLVAAVMWHESDFQNVARNETNDYGLMQVHWQPQERWLSGLHPADLMDPWTNILAGVRELAALRRYCRLRDPVGAHHWVGHYKYGVVVLSQRYGKIVLWRRDQLIRMHPSS